MRKVASESRGSFARSPSPRSPASTTRSSASATRRLTSRASPPSSNGEETSLTLSDIKEDVVVVVFLANHCPVVQAYEDRVIDFTNDYKDKGVKVVGICRHRSMDQRQASRHQGLHEGAQVQLHLRL